MGRITTQVEIGIENFGVRSTGQPRGRGVACNRAGRSGVHDRISSEPDPVVERIGIAGPRPAHEKLARVRSRTEVIVVEGAGVNIHVGARVADAAQTDVSPDQTGEAHGELRYDRAGTSSPVVAGESKNPLADARAVHDDGIGDAKRSTARGTRSRSSRATGRVGRAAAPATDHHRARVEGRAGSAGIDDPELSELVTYEEAPAGEIVHRAIWPRRRTAR